MSNKWPDGFGRRVLTSVDSTNEEARRIAPGLLGPTWILALEQTKGRGRRGRVWVAPKGHFAATLVMCPKEPPNLVALRSFVASLALYDAFAQATGRTSGLTLKWPNDVLLNGGKVAGILLESGGYGTGQAHLAIGIGVNLIDAPDSAMVEPGAVAPVSLAGETGVQLDPEAFLDLLAPSYAHYETQFSTYGFEPIREAWLARAAKLGEVIIARTMQHEYQGRFDTVDGEGNLVLSTATGREVIPAAEIFF
ncbi:Bifunctional ligase/repressor BirA [Aliiroseovarius sp. xm-m-379]|uniref:biotin--[acetyl-CoA-carboxylase] ligase n=1 Tax=unclassified Aliiroseovarius TaxID=2623558 RepID=UPI001569EF9B|nr:MULTISPECIES: biotin--[acetyl-CoA-carboxylase] ligase [unclassified Aliiroseovarius]NRP12297.1 Bifunctional ligase/repressor BirA [Aliiroseovarius sp. xm-d-517]NRP24671.1 Bifunctional ligase/repressor BirA [Aliiroseovarius sp. xm-m-379]NRP30695.1 Bifunctional ligase/repressor BirA [Aliiroseovarius sp. xm-m-314]NRP33470.1 Bifunctional ligase/repressor BirA [Aliiroseovarius sp. xm-a-104]NRP40577.1 Bifunctional ligase/repressor BirA [Aliiroseovarius sp. xm-m-339-2]